MAYRRKQILINNGGGVARSVWLAAAWREMLAASWHGAENISESGLQLKPQCQRRNE